MRLKEFKPNMVIHCKNGEELKALLDELTILGYKWWGDGTLPNSMLLHTPILINTYEDFGIDKKITYSAVDEKENYTEFSDLIIPELSSAEILETLYEICVGRSCTGCVFEKCCPTSSRGKDFNKTIEICTKWREEHPKEEKKELETEWVYVVRIIKVHDNGKKECVMEIEEGESRDGIEDKIEHDLKLYTENHKGNFFATLEHICRIKE